MNQIYQEIPIAKQIGFEFDMRKVETEMKQVFEVYENYYDIISGKGSDFQKDFAFLQNEFAEAGLDKIVDEMNRQLEEFQAD